MNKLIFFLAFVIILGILAALAWAASQLNAPYQIGTPIEISLDPRMLPGYAANTVLRMFIALFCSLLFTFLVAPLSAKSKQAGKIIIPLIDILQSVPILGMLAITVVAFIQLFPNSLLGPECAAIFAIFTSQVWNMTLSFHQSLLTVPKEFYETAAIFHLSGWQRFWRIEVPHAIPSLLWNTMASLSAGWFFVVASEAISVTNQNIMLPGIGSYISVAIGKADLKAIYYAILTMFMVIVLYDQLLLRPLLTWAERYQSNQNEDALPNASWFYNLLAKTQLLKYADLGFSRLADSFLNPPRIPKQWFSTPYFNKPLYAQSIVILWNVALIIGIVISLLFLWEFITKTVGFQEIQRVFYLGGITLIKVAILIIIASIIWVPIGVWIGLHPKASNFFQPFTQFLAAFPINLVYPIAVTLIVGFHLNVEVWTTPLMILGTQWYILFNVIAGSSAIPKELHLVTQNFGVTRWLWWKRLALPAIFPYYVTGAMTAAGGCWNASIVAEVLEWGNHKLIATGLGSYISQYTTVGDFPRIALGIAVMAFYVIVINRLLWQKLYQVATSRFQMD